MEEKTNIVLDNGILVSSDHGSWNSSVPQGSFYQELRRSVNFHLKSYGDWDWLVDCITGEVTRASEVDGSVKRFAAVFRRFGLGKGDGIHLVVGNHNKSFLALFAAWYLGGFGSCGDVALDSKAIAGQINDTAVKLVICTPETAGTVIKAVELSDRSDCTKVFCFGKHEDVADLLTLVSEANESDALVAVNVDNIMKDRLVVFWSSGTTGLPKGICHSHFSAWNALSAMSDEIPAHCNNVGTTCFFHIGGFFFGIRSILERQSYFHMFGKQFTLDILLNAIKKAKPGVLMLGAHHYVQLSEHDFHASGEITTDDLLSVTKIFPAGSAVPAICEQKLKEKFPNLESVFNGYGQTECGMISIGKRNSDLGLLHPAGQLKIVHPDSGKICEPGEVGEICFKGPSMMIEYLKRPIETDNFFDSDGFGRTGDIGYYDIDGKIRYVDRMKELIKFKNNHVAPTEIEAILQTHPAVIESLVFGKKCPEVQELISAVVVKKENSKVTAEELQEFVNSQVIDYKKIRGDVIFKDKIPHNSVGKLLRREMRRWAETQSLQ